MASIEKIEEHVVYENPAPQNHARHGCFPGLVHLAPRVLLAMFTIGEAFESTDRTTHLARSPDDGRTWTHEGPLHDKSAEHRHDCDSMKAVRLASGALLATGYRFHRTDPDQPLVNIETDGVRPGDALVARSNDDGRTWTTPRVIATRYPEVIELSGPAVQMQSGAVLAAGSLFPRWDGSRPSGAVGPLLRSDDEGQTWDDARTFFHDPTAKHTPAEVRLCEMQPGRVVALWWMIDHAAGKSLANHIAVSRDGGDTWSGPIDTGVLAQASNLMHWEGDRLLTIHAHREGHDVGVFVRWVDLAGDRWREVTSQKIWGNAPSATIGTYAGMSQGLRFGQPSLLRLSDDEVLATHWTIENGQGRVLTHRLRVAP